MDNKGHIGETQFRQLCHNVDNLTLLSLYSGLGGAELSLQSLHTAVTKELEQLHEQGQLLDVPLPRAPTFLLSCDFESSCQTVLKQHEHPPAHVVGNILDFVTAETSSKCEKIVETAKAKLAKLQSTEKTKNKKEPKAKAKANNKDLHLDTSWPLSSLDPIASDRI